MKYTPYKFQLRTIASYDPKKMQKYGRVLKEYNLLAHLCHKENNQASITLKSYPPVNFTHVVSGVQTYEIVDFQISKFFTYELKATDEN